MKNQVVAVRVSVTTEQIADLVQSLGGYWNSEPTLNQGVIKQGAASVFVSRLSGLDAELEADEARDLLGEEPKALIDIHIGHGVGSDSLAKAVCAEILERWGGTLM